MYVMANDSVTSIDSLFKLVRVRANNIIERDCDAKEKTPVRRMALLLLALFSPALAQRPRTFSKCTFPENWMAEDIIRDASAYNAIFENNCLFHARNCLRAYETFVFRQSSEREKGEAFYER